jgi:hypothetical protein
MFIFMEENYIMHDHTERMFLERLNLESCWPQCTSQFSIGKQLQEAYVIEDPTVK